MTWVPRLAQMADLAALERLIPLSVRGLQHPYYGPEQMEAALGEVFAVDRQLILDGTYWVVEHEGELVGAGGWSRRGSLCGGDHGRSEVDPVLTPGRDAARIRAFFVHPAWARRGLGRTLLATCESAAFVAGFRQLELVATLAGELLYRAAGFGVMERYKVVLPGGLDLPVVRMWKDLPVSPAPVS